MFIKTNFPIPTNPTYCIHLHLHLEISRAAHCSAVPEDNTTQQTNLELTWRLLALEQHLVRKTLGSSSRTGLDTRL